MTLLLKIYAESGTRHPVPVTQYRSPGLGHRVSGTGYRGTWSFDAFILIFGYTDATHFPGPRDLRPNDGSRRHDEEPHAANPRAARAYRERDPVRPPAPPVHRQSPPQDPR